MLPDAHRRQDELDRFRTLLVTSVNAGCSLQALMALLGHVSAEMSLRYGRLFDATVREEYTRALSLAKARLGPVLPGERTQLPLAAVTSGNWRDAPLIKARLAGGYCLRTAAQGSCAYANICEHCPNFRSEASFLPVLQLQRADAEALAADAAARGWDATTLSGLAVQIDQLRRSLEAVAANVRRHEETIRRLERARRKPG